MTTSRLQTALLTLTEVMTRLRKECPWDRRQTHESLRRYLLEETFEVLETLDEGDHQALRGELGDLLFQIWFHAELASEGTDGFDLADVVEGITDKLTRRHPHVFGEVVAADAVAVKRNWEQLKLTEKGRDSLLDGLPRALPALAASFAIQEKVATVGFDWTDPKDVADKAREEMAELLAEIPPAGTEATADEMLRIRQEFGDLLFSLVNYGRHLGVTAEESLREANRKFERRFREVEAGARRAGRTVADMTLDEMQALWDDAKHREREA